MQILRTSQFLRWVLIVDAVTCFASGLLLTLGASLLGGYLGLPEGLLRYSGISLLPFAALLVYLATREHISSPAVWAVIVLNTLWTIDSILLLLTGSVTPTEMGNTFVVTQALGVAVLTVLEYFGLKKSARVTAVAS
jgi:hypothetical protein